MTTTDRHAGPRAAASLEEARRRLGVGRLAGLLLLAGTVLSALAHTTLRDPVPPQPLWAPAAVAVVTGAVCLVLPWRSLGAGWLHLLPVTSSLLVAGVVAANGSHGQMYAPLYFVVAAFAAYAFRSRRAVAAHVGLVGACVAAPLAYAPVSSPGPASELAVFGGSLVGVTWLMVVVRERMEAGQDALRELAQSDPLTGVGNYRRLYSRMTYEMARHRRSRLPLALLVLDLDGFKAVNDTLGHPAGDRLLREVADVLRATVREQDTVARQGGDEFAVLAPETGPMAAAVLVARIERALGEIDSDETPIGASVGWAVFPEDAEDRMALMECADARQRAVKRGRRASGAKLRTRLSA